MSKGPKGPKGEISQKIVNKYKKNLNFQYRQGIKNVKIAKRVTKYQGPIQKCERDAPIKVKPQKSQKGPKESKNTKRVKNVALSL